MKKTILIFAAAALLVSCQTTGKTKSDAPKAEGGQVSDSYAFGLLIGDNMKSLNVTIDYGEFTKGFKAGLEDKDGKVSLDAANAIAQAAVQGARKKQGEANQAAADKFLAANKDKKGVITTESGLQYEVLVQGDGAKPSASDTVSVDYEGKLLSGKVFDSSIARGEPIAIRPDQVIPGWTEALQLMNVGSTIKLYVPSSLGYGPDGAGEDIGPNELLVFEVRLLGIVPAGQDGEAPEGWDAE